LCGYGAWDEISGCRHRDLFYLWHRGGPLAGGREHLQAATFLSLAAWLVLGFFAASIAQQPKPKNYVLNVLNSGELDLQAPLRWRGILRDEPVLCVVGASRNYITNMFTSIAMNKALQLRALARQGGYDGNVSFRARLAAWLLRIERT
jgi:hypothetical protein